LFSKEYLGKKETKNGDKHRFHGFKILILNELNNKQSPFEASPKRELYLKMVV
jgi:hypothetical protein